MTHLLDLHHRPPLCPPELCAEKPGWDGQGMASGLPAAGAGTSTTVRFTQPQPQLKS